MCVRWRHLSNHRQCKVICPGSRQTAASVRAPAVIAVDLGFSAMAKSCGLAWRTPQSSSVEDLTFGDCVAQVAELISEWRTADLIIEAPLSGLFSDRGNPLGRREFELRPAREDRKAEHRYWYSGPGASTCLAALFFLDRLRREIGTRESVSVTLYEGFLSFKLGGTRHSIDAQRLLDGFVSQTAQVLEVIAPAKASVSTLLDILDPSGVGTAAPAVVLIDG